uniref:Non-specific serine/threonine protein kinase n=1 Tax=Caenorhabditis tropicalis TaxID=1561998 RepID=A0A1I7UJV2_9PELO
MTNMVQHFQLSGLLCNRENDFTFEFQEIFGFISASIQETLDFPFKSRHAFSDISEELIAPSMKEFSE